jgi:two-component system, NarL family, invasion response regulator UvrY
MSTRADPSPVGTDGVADMNLSVMLVDDHAVFRQAARRVVAAAPQFELVAEATTGEGAVQLADRLAPRVVLMDINLPGINGIEASRQIVARHPATLVVLLSTYAASDIADAVGSSGALCYVHKAQFGRSVLTEVWRRAHSGRSPASN